MGRIEILFMCFQKLTKTTPFKYLSYIEYLEAIPLRKITSDETQDQERLAGNLILL